MHRQTINATAILKKILDNRMDHAAHNDSNITYLILDLDKISSGVSRDEMKSLVRALMTLLKGNTHVKSLDFLGAVNLDDSCAEILAKGLPLTQVKELNIRISALSSYGIIKILKSVDTLTFIGFDYLSSRFNYVSDRYDAVIDSSLLRAITNHPNLKSFACSGNSTHHFNTFIHQYKILLSTDYSYNFPRITDSEWALVESTLKRNQSSQQQDKKSQFDESAMTVFKRKQPDSTSTTSHKNDDGEKFVI